MVERLKTRFAPWSGPHRYATMGPRLAAACIDLLPFAPLLGIGLYYQDEWHGRPWGWIWPALNLTLSSGYFIFFHSRYGATPGKALMRCRLVSDESETPLTSRQAVIRELPWIAVSVLSVIPFGGFGQATHYADSLWLVACFVFIIYDLKHRSLDDCLAGVVLVRQTKEHPSEPPAALAAYPLPHHFTEATPQQRIAAALINLFFVSAMTGVATWLTSPDMPMAAEFNPALWQIKAGWFTLFWLTCGVLRSSPGATALGLRFHDVEGRLLPRHRCLFRSAPFLLVFLIMHHEKTDGIQHYIQAVGAVLFFLMISNAVALTTSSRSLIDRWLKVRVYATRQPRLKAPVYTR